MWATHLSLVVAAFCSRPRLQFVRGCPKRPWCDTYQVPDTRTCSWTTLYSFFSIFLFFFSAGSSIKHARGNSTSFCCCLLLLYFYYFGIFRVSSNRTACWFIIWRKRRSLLHEVKVVMLLLILMYSYIVHFSRHVHKQSTPTTETNGSTHTSKYTLAPSTPKYYTFLRAQLELDVVLPARMRVFFMTFFRYLPPSEGKSCISVVNVLNVLILLLVLQLSCRETPPVSIAALRQRKRSSRFCLQD